MSSLCSLGYPGHTMTFRINPDAVDWNFSIEKAIINTLGGRVVQILGTTLSDVVVKGKIGEDHSKSGDDGASGRSWVMAEAFVKKIHGFMAYQRSAPVPTSKPYDRATTTPPLRFTFPEFDWDFSCYVKEISDPSGGGAITHSAGKFSYDYALTLFIEAENSASVAVLQGKAAQAAEAYISRISQGIGWDRSTVRQYSGRSLDQAIYDLSIGAYSPPDDGTTPTTTSTTTTGAATTSSTSPPPGSPSTSVSSASPTPTSTPSPPPTRKPV